MNEDTHSRFAGLMVSCFLHFTRFPSLPCLSSPHMPKLGVSDFIFGTEGLAVIRAMIQGLLRSWQLYSHCKFSAYSMGRVTPVIYVSPCVQA